MDIAQNRKYAVITLGARRAIPRVRKPADSREKHIVRRGSPEKRPLCEKFQDCCGRLKQGRPGFESSHGWKYELLLMMW